MGGACTKALPSNAKVVHNSDIPLPPAFYDEYDIFVIKKQINKAKAQNLAHSDIDNAHGGILGAGSFSIVLKCLHKKSGDIRAVKYVEKKRMIGLRNKKVADKLIKEVHRGIELLRGLQHPNIIRLYDFFESNKVSNRP